MPAPTPPSLYLQITRAIKGGDLFTLRGLLRNQSDWARLLGVDQVVDLPYDAACDAKWEIFQLLLANGFGRQNRRLAGKLIAGVCRADISEPEMLSRVDELLLQGADAGPPNPFLNIAAKRGYVSVVARLLDAGADVEDTSHDGVPVLHELAWMFRGDPTITQRGRYAVAELLLNHGADVNGGKTQKRMPIRQAVASGDLRMVRLLLQHGATANIANSWGDTPLHEAVIRHSDDSSGLIQSEESEVVETVRLLLAAGANPNALDSERKTPLHNALHPKAIPEVVEALLAHGADPLITMVKNENALDYALKVGNAAITRLVLEQLPRGFMVGGRSDAYIEAAAPKDAVVGLQLLCSYGLVVGTRYPHGRMSPLHTAARYGAAGVLEMCLSAGSSPNVRDRLGRTPLYMAARYNRPDAITVLLRHGGDATIADKDGVTPLRIAQQKNKKHAVAVLTTVIPQPNL